MFKISNGNGLTEYYNTKTKKEAVVLFTDRFYDSFFGPLESGDHYDLISPHNNTTLKITVEELKWVKMILRIM